MPVKKIAVIGSGTMGSGIALTAATHGINAVVIDINEDQIVIAKKYHEKQIQRSVVKKRMTQDEADAALANLSYKTAMEDASEANWAIEAATENIEIKKSIFKHMFDVFGDDVVLATNTSSISESQLVASPRYEIVPRAVAIKTSPLAWFIAIS